MVERLAVRVRSTAAGRSHEVVPGSSPGDGVAGVLFHAAFSGMLAREEKVFQRISPKAE